MSALTLAQALAELPDTADGIADRMRALGIKGKRHYITCCPLATFLRDKGIRGAVIDGMEASIRGVDDFTPLTGSQAEFVRRFDAGVYLDLVEVDRG